MTEKVEYKIGDTVKLTPSQVQLINELRGRLSEPMMKAAESVKRMVDELTFIRVREIADELGLDVINDNWRYDANNNSFIMVDEDGKVPALEPKKVIPKKRADTKAKG